MTELRLVYPTDVPPPYDASPNPRIRVGTDTWIALSDITGLRILELDPYHVPDHHAAQYRTASPETWLYAGHDDGTTWRTAWTGSIESCREWINRVWPSERYDPSGDLDPFLGLPDEHPARLATPSTPPIL